MVSFVAPLRQLSDLRNELAAAGLLALIAIPLNAGVAVASGVPIEFGIASAIIGGILGGLLTDPPTQVIGPAAALAVGVWALVRGEGSAGAALLGPTVIVLGLLQILFGLSRLTSWFRVVGPSIVRGVMSGIGLAIILSQAYSLVDLHPQESTLRNLLGLGDAVLVAVAPPTGTTHNVAAVIGLGSILLMGAYSLIRPPQLARLPAPVIGVAIVIACTVFVRLPIRHVGTQVRFDELFSFANAATWSAYLHSPQALLSTLGLALVSTSEGLLCASTLEETSGRRARLHRSLVAIGVANVACGLVGALPVTAVIVRTTVNGTLGARTRFSSVMHAVLILLLAVPLARILRQVPYSAVAAIVVFIGWKLVDLEGAKRIEGDTPGAAWSWFGAALATLLVGPQVGIVAGLAIAALLLLRRALAFEAKLECLGTGFWRLTLSGAAIFLRLPGVLAALEEVPDEAEIQVSLEKVTLLDDAFLSLLRKLELERARLGGRFAVEWKEARRLAATGTGTYNAVPKRARKDQNK